MPSHSVFAESAQRSAACMQLAEPHPHVDLGMLKSVSLASELASSSYRKADSHRWSDWISQSKRGFQWKPPKPLWICHCTWTDDVLHSSLHMHQDCACYSLTAVPSCTRRSDISPHRRLACCSWCCATTARARAMVATLLLFSSLETC